MARSRKTMNVNSILDYANKQLERKDSEATKEFKYGVCVMIEQILFRTDNYNGFRFLDSNETQHDTLGHASRKYYKPNHT